MDVNLQDFLEKIIDPSDKILFEEAFGCYKNGLYRSGYIVARLCIAESLKRKIKYFSDSGSNGAKDALEIIEGKENTHNSADNTIIVKSKELQIISREHVADIEFFYKKRCLFAHPYEIAPSESELSHILIKAIEIVLGKSNLFGKEYAQEGILKDLESRFYLGEESHEIITFAKGYLLKLKNDLHPWIYKECFYKGSTHIEDDNPQWIISRYKRFIGTILFENKEKIHEESERKIKNHLDHYPKSFFKLCFFPELWAFYGKETKDTLIRIIKDKTLSEEYEYGLISKLCKIINDEGVSNCEKDFIKEYIKNAPLYMIHQSLSVDLLFKHLHQYLIEYDRNQQNKGISFLRDLQHRSSLLDGGEKQGTVDQQTQLGRDIANCYLSNNRQVTRNMDYFIRSGSKFRHFLKGFLIGLFINEMNEYRTSISLGRLIGALDSLDLGSQSDILAEIELAYSKDLHIDYINYNSSDLKEFIEKYPHFGLKIKEILEEKNKLYMKENGDEDPF